MTEETRRGGMLEKYKRMIRANMKDLVQECECGTPKDKFKEGEKTFYGVRQKCPTCDRDYVHIKYNPPFPQEEEIDLGTIPKEQHDYIIKNDIFGKVENICLC